MTDPRYPKLAKLLVNYSCALKRGERILLDLWDVPDEFAVELLRAVRAAGGVPFFFGIPGICDGIAMGHSGMKYSLASRELIADINLFSFVRSAI